MTQQRQIRKIFKYPLPMTDSPSVAVPIKLPVGAKICKVAEQGSDPFRGPQFFLWALVDPDEKFEEVRYVVTAGTGHEIELTTLSARDWEFSDSVFAMGGRLVVHVWISRPVGRAIEVTASGT